jgi:hypothetical protein
MCNDSDQQQQPPLSTIQIPEKYAPSITAPDKPVANKPQVPMTSDIDTTDATDEPNHRSSEIQQTVSAKPERTTNDETLVKLQTDITQSNRTADNKAQKITPGQNDSNRCSTQYPKRWSGSPHHLSTPPHSVLNRQSKQRKSTYRSWKIMILIYKELSRGNKRRTPHCDPDPNFDRRSYSMQSSTTIRCGPEFVGH